MAETHNETLTKERRDKEKATHVSQDDNIENHLLTEKFKKSLEESSMLIHSVTDFENQHEVIFSNLRRSCLAISRNPGLFERFSENVTLESLIADCWCFLVKIFSHKMRRSQVTECCISLLVSSVWKSALNSERVQKSIAEMRKEARDSFLAIGKDGRSIADIQSGNNNQKNYNKDKLFCSMDNGESHLPFDKPSSSVIERSVNMNPFPVSVEMGGGMFKENGDPFSYPVSGNDHSPERDDLHPNERQTDDLFRNRDDRAKDDSRGDWWSDSTETEEMRLYKIVQKLKAEQQKLIQKQLNLENAIQEVRNARDGTSSEISPS